MSDLWTAPSRDSETSARRRALWGLLILAVIAGLLLGLMALFLGGSGGGHSGGTAAGGGTLSAQSQPPASAVVTPTRTPATSAKTTAAPTRRPSTTAHPTPASTANPCPSTAPCVVAGDDGGAGAALNAFRTSHGLPAVRGGATAQAQQCALSQGNGPTCAPHYAWQPVTTRDGAKVISAIAGLGDGRQWLLDPGMTSFSVGWAYVPGPGGAPGQYECAILKVG